MKTLFTFFCFLSLINALQASDQGGIYIQQANQAYEEGNYPEAKSFYENALNEGVANSDVYYNYANTLFRLEKLGEAILYYEKALKLSPTDEDIQVNLKFANAQTIDKHPQPDYNVITKFIWFLHSSYDLNTALWLALGLFSGLFVLGILLLYLPQPSRFLIFPLMAFILLLLLTASPSIIFRMYEQEAVRFGIVLSPTLEIYSGPGANAAVAERGSVFGPACGGRSPTSSGRPILVRPPVPPTFTSEGASLS